MEQYKTKQSVFPRHGGDLEKFSQDSGKPLESVINFSSNINPLGFSSEVKRVYLNAVSKIMDYPDPYASELCEVIANFHQIAANQVMAGNGSMALMDLVVRTLRPKKTLLIEPCFTEYRRLCELYHSQVKEIVLNHTHGFRFDLNAMISSLDEVDFVILGFPNNPTGTALSQRELRIFLKEAQLRGVVVMLDEAFVDWMPEQSVMAYLQHYPTLILVRSMTKFFAMAGIRIGYICSSPIIINQLMKYQVTWSCNQLAQDLAIAALKDTVYQKKVYQWYGEESQFFAHALKQVQSLTIFPSQANYFLCQITDQTKVEPFWQLMKRLGIYLREVSDFRGLDRSYFRVALKTRDENVMLLKQLTQFLGQVSFDQERLASGVR